MLYTAAWSAEGGAPKPGLRCMLWPEMFGLFNPRRRLQDLLARLELSKELNRLCRDAPGATYLFARTLLNARPLLDDENRSRRKKIKALGAEMTQIEATRSDLADAGVSILALSFLQTLLAAKEPIGYRFIYEEISRFGQRYRELEPRDRLPPDDETSRAILAKRGYSCVGDVVDAVEAECIQKGYDLSDAEEDVQRILALYDLRDEASSGRLMPRLNALAIMLGIARSPQFAKGMDSTGFP